MRHNNFLKNFLTALSLMAILSPSVASAADFNPHFIISDTEIRDTDSMDYGDILLFLASKGHLNDVKDIDPEDGEVKDAARLIYDTANRYEISPKYLLALIQKESSAVESTTLTERQLDWATGYAICDSCSKDSLTVQKYRGFAKQVVSGASWMDWYLKGEAVNLAQAGEYRTIDQTSVKPVNLATAALYSYTPHVHGNRLLWSIWNRWFGAGAESFNYPDGTLLRNASTGGVAIMLGGLLRPIASKTVLLTRFNQNNIVSLNDYDFETIMRARRGPTVRFPDLSLVQIEDQTIYLLVGNERRKIVSPQVFAHLGFNPEEVSQAKFSDITDYREGADIDENSAPPSGDLIKEPNGKIWYTEGEEKHRIFDPGVLLANFPLRPIREASQQTIDRLMEGPAVSLIDGTLAKTSDSPRVFIITAGEKRAIPDEKTFLAFGYQWNKIVTVSQATLNLHPDGAQLSFNGYAQ